MRKVVCLGFLSGYIEGGFFLGEEIGVWRGGRDRFGGFEG